MQQEYSSLMDNGTWELVDLPFDCMVVNIKSDTMAAAGGAAAAPEGGALASPSAPTFTSTRWALVTP
jgi:hypothetical protein